MHMCLLTSQHWFRKWIVNCLLQRHYLHQCELIFVTTLRNLAEILTFSLKKMYFENIICNMVTIYLGLNVLMLVPEGHCPLLLASFNWLFLNDGLG